MVTFDWGNPEMNTRQANNDMVNKALGMTGGWALYDKYTKNPGFNEIPGDATQPDWWTKNADILKQLRDVRYSTSFGDTLKSAVSQVGPIALAALGGYYGSLGGAAGEVGASTAGGSSGWGASAGQGAAAGMGSAAGGAVGSSIGGLAGLDAGLVGGLGAGFSAGMGESAGALTSSELASLYPSLGASGFNSSNNLGDLFSSSNSGQAQSTLGTASSNNVPGISVNNQPATDIYNTTPDSFTTGDYNDYGSSINTDASSAGYEGTGLKPSTNSGIGIQNSSPQYSWQDKSFMGTPSGTGIQAGASPDISNLNLANAGPQNAAGYSFTQPKTIGENMLNMYNGANNSPAGQAYNQSRLVKGLANIYDAVKGGQQVKQTQALVDPYADQRGLAQNKWNEITQNPEAAWAQYIGGQGKDFMTNAAAKYAAAGRRNMLPTLMNQAHQQYLSSYLPSYKQSVNPNQFGPTAGAAQALLGAQNQQSGNWGSAVSNLMGNPQVTKTLSDIYNWF